MIRAVSNPVGVARAVLRHLLDARRERPFDDRNSQTRHPAVTTLLPCRDVHPPFLREALASVLAQTSPNWRLSVVTHHDDPTSPRTVAAALADLGASDHPAITLLETEGRLVTATLTPVCDSADTLRRGAARGRSPHPRRLAGAVLSTAGGMSGDEPREPTVCSVIIPTYNRAGWLPTCVDSVRRSGTQGTEIILVDDGSTDDTRAVVRQLGPGVRYFYQPNAGEAAARNHGIRRSRRRYVAFLDSDDRYLDRPIATYEKHGGNLSTLADKEPAAENFVRILRGLPGKDLSLTTRQRACVRAGLARRLWGWGYFSLTKGEHRRARGRFVESIQVGGSAYRRCSTGAAAG